MGMNSKTIYRRCLPEQPWQRVLPGIILLRNGKATQDQRVMAALLYAGPEALITGAEACRRHGLRPQELPADNALHVLVPHQHKLKSSEFLTVERTIRLPEPVVRGGIPLTPLVRAATDTVRRIRMSKPVGQLLVETIQRGRCTTEELFWELNNGTQRGTAIPRRVLAEWERVRSVAEAQAKKLSRELLVRPSHWNTNVCKRDGSYVGCPDAWWDDVALAWEIDSFDFHFGREGYARTLERNTRYAAAGITVVQTLPSRLEKDPAGVLAELQAAYRAAGACPRPPVHLAAASS
jgi:hypothetical protein